MTKEESLQVAIADYLRLQYPDILFCHIANERQTSPARGAKLKRMGVRKGMPDIMIYRTKLEMYEAEGFRLHSGLALELKIKPNKPTPEQLKILDILEQQGWVTAVTYDFDESKKLIDNYLND